MNGAFPPPSCCASAHRTRKTICGSYRLVLTELAGDWKWLKEILRLRHTYNRDLFCFLCCATKSPGSLCAWHFVRTAACFFAERSNINFLAHLNEFGSEVAKLPGFHLGMVILDLMHIALLGCMQFLVVGALWWLCWEEKVWGMPRKGSWKNRVNAQLASAFRDFKEFLKRNRISSSQTMFNVNMLNMHSLQDCAEMKCKAANCLYIGTWLSEVLSAAKPTTPKAQARAASMWGVCAMLCLVAEM